jgi:hypothetical protein
MEYLEIMRAEMTPELFGGKSGKKRIPQWNIFCEGDMQDDTVKWSIKLDPKKLPPGTKVSVQIPVCPKCRMDYENCNNTKECDFDWKKWEHDNFG